MADSLQLWKDGEVEPKHEDENLNCREMLLQTLEGLAVEWDDRSMRYILKELSSLVEPARPSDYDMTTEAFVLEWAEQLDEMGESQEPERKAYLDELMYAARHILKFDASKWATSLKSAHKTIAYYTMSDDGGTIGTQFLVVPSDGEGPPKVVEETIDYNFRISEQSLQRDTTF